MKVTRASLRYAKATLAFAEDADSSQKVSDDMQALSALMKENEELSSVMQTQKLFSLLARNNRMELLGGTCEQYIELFAAQKGEVKAIVTTAIALTAELKQQVLQEAKKLSDKKAILENKIDPSIIGGYILKIGDMQYDASVSNQLNTIKTTLTKTNSI
jgi:F-type H+-transporting ATPase subunit delta